jgi:hypothetical protein
MFPERLKRILFNIFLHPASLTLPVALGVLWLVPDVFDKYTISLDYEQVLGPGIIFEYYDLDHDGNSEWAGVSNTIENNAGISIHNQLGTIFHWHFEGSFIPDQQKCMVGDIDNDGHDEIYAFTMKGDSLLMHCIDYRIYPELVFKSLFITTIPGKKPEYNFKLALGKITDLDGDGSKEVVFMVIAGYEGTPRKVFAYDGKRKHLKSSIELGNYSSDISFIDMDNDGKDEMLLVNSAPGNVKDKHQIMQDTCGYLIALDNTLSFLFPPIFNPGLYNGVHSYPLKTTEGKLIAAFFLNTNQEPGNPSIRIYNKKGELLRKKELALDYRTQGFTIQPIGEGKGNLLIIPPSKELVLLDENLDTIKKSDIRMGFGSLFQFDLDLDGKKELIFPSTKPGQWVILRDNFKYPVNFPTDISEKAPIIFNVLRGSKKPEFSFQLGNWQAVYEYSFNKMYYWQYPVYLGIYLGILGFILLIQRILKIQLQKKYETEKRIAELQYVSLQNQISPHFTFNVLNTIGSAINQEKKDEAYQMLLKFSKLLRTLLTDPETVTRTLKEELEFVSNFLEIQQHRFKDVFTFSIDLDQDVNMDQLLPKACIQTYIENSLKHGIAPMKYNGEIKITIIKKEKHLQIKVTDNGVGRGNSAKTNSISTGRGLKIIHQYYELLNKANKEPITEEFIDLTDLEGNLSGTEVTINIPLNFNFTLSSASTISGS